MNWIQVLLIVSVLALLVYLLRSRTQRAVQGVGQGRLRAVRDRRGLRVLRPDDTTVVANWLGVDRGTDLMRLRADHRVRASPR